MDYTEDTLVQQTTAEYLERQLGWQSVYAYNNEDFGPGSLLGRTSDREVVLTRPLREKLVSLNPGLPDAAYDDAVRQITVTVASQTLVATNREKYAQLRDGVQVTFRNERGERVRQRLRVLDFETPENNDFLCVRELWVKGEATRDAVRVTIHDYLWTDKTGLPVDVYTEDDVNERAEDVFRHVYRAYPTLPSPYYAAAAP